jgi:DNA-directed RNA polymerase specialized sigma24 family protein
MESAGLLAAAYELHAGTVADYVRGLVGADLYLAEDLAADVWLRITGNLDRVDERVLDLHWLEMIARSVVREQHPVLEVPVGLADAVRAFAPAPTGDETVVAKEPAHESGAQEQFRTSHGDVTTWSATDFETYGNLAGAPAVTRSPLAEVRVA